VWVSQTKH
jgi:hypothetical protein